MRKINIMVIVAGAAIVASCSDTTKLNNEIRQDTKTEKIGFVTYSEKATRADQDNSVNLYDFYKTFDVYAWKTANGQSQSVFSHVPVEYFTANSTAGEVVYATDFSKLALEWGNDWATDNNLKGWLYEDVRYWDKLATKYNFYAIAPYEETPSPALTIADNDANIKIGATDDIYKVSTEKNLAIVDNKVTEGKKYFGFLKDYMLADKSGTKNQLVTLNFHHILTKLNVKITLTNAYKGTQPFTIKKLHIVGLEDEGYFVYNTDMTTNGWTTKEGSTYDLDIDKDFILKNVPTDVEDKTEYSGYYWIQTLIFPQTLTCSAEGALTAAPTGKYLYIEYTIGNEPFKAYYDLAYVFDNTLECIKDAVLYTDEELAADASLSQPKKPAVTVAGTYALEQGSEYTVNIKVGPEPIVFEAKSAKWAVEDEIEHSVL